MVSVYGAMTHERKARIWEFWRRGVAMSEISRDIAKPAATIYSYLLYHGGIEPRHPVRRNNSLSLDEREAISRGLSAGVSMRAVAKELGRSPSTISREIARNGGAKSYRAHRAEGAFIRHSKRPKQLLLAENDKLRETVIRMLESDWSPEQISGWLKRTSPEGSNMHISHETIYKSLFIQTHGVLKEELKKHLRTRRMFRQGKAHKAGVRGQIPDAISIRERPAEIDDRAIPGHWEGDLIVGYNQSAIATIVERHSRFTLLCNVKNKQAVTVVQALTQQMQSLPEKVLGSLTWDRGQEMSAHKTFTLATNMAVYFCAPSSPWQRGTNENTNGLLRQYLPKGTQLAAYTQEQLDAIAWKLNTRPRKSLGFRTPADVFEAVLH